VALSEWALERDEGRAGPVGFHLRFDQGAGTERAAGVRSPGWGPLTLVEPGTPTGAEDRRGQLHDVHVGREVQDRPQTTALAEMEFGVSGADIGGRKADRGPRGDVGPAPGIGIGPFAHIAHALGGSTCRTTGGA